MTFPLSEYLINKMRTHYYFEKDPPVPDKAQFTLPQGPGFGIELERIQNRIENRFK
jgi:L-alanine-DL-glutamate epimerase-like enolase superfamily enzyme